MAQTDQTLLLEMGFEPRRAELALKHTGGLQDALTWLETNQDVSNEDLESKFGSTVTAGASSVSKAERAETSHGEGEAGGATKATQGEAKSYKCNDCGKLLRNWNAVQFHAEKTEHQNFDESVDEIAPLTEEQKKAKLEELREKLAEKRKTQAVESVLEAKRNEAIRKKKDQESEKMKEELRKKEQLKDIERKRQEKLDDAKAKAKIKAEIAATQQARREAAAKAKAEREGLAQTVIQEPTPAASSSTKPIQSYSEARLRFQIAGRPPITKTFPADTSLFEVGVSLAQEAGLTVNTLTTTFPPRKTYKLQEALEAGMTLKEANLTPSASLLVG